jgi:glycosyltransferase involved in cell wall biosynthesis
VLSLAIIAKDEADRIADCIRSVPAADEVLVLDSGSSDRTAAVAADLGARVIATDWPGHVAQKNRALAAARGDWILSLDADERLSPEAAAQVTAALAAPGDAVGFSFPRCSHWLGRPIRHGRWYPDRKLRLVRAGRGRWGGDDPHDRLEVDGPVRRLSGDILHFPYRDLAEHLATIERYGAISAASLARRGVAAHWYDLALRPPAHFLDAWLLRRGFLDGVPGFFLAGLGAGHVLAKWGRLYFEPPR